MCVIIQLQEKKIISFEKFKNAVLNNPDGWGVVFKDRGKLTVRKDCNPKGNDPDELYKVILDASGIERYVHVRKNTVGKTIIENAHPFTLLDIEGDRRVEFMHNGTIGEYRPTTGSDLSDTRNYAETYLTPLLQKFHGEHGVGDYTDPFFNNLVKSTFNFSNRGLFIASDLDIKEFGKWEDFKDGEDVFRVSNNDYFNHVMVMRTSVERYTPPQRPQQQQITYSQQGGSPVNQQAMFRQSEPETAPKVAEADAKPKQPTQGITSLKDVNLAKVLSVEVKASDLNDLMDLTISEWDDIENESLTYFNYLARFEIENWVEKHPSTASFLLELVFARFHEMFNEHAEATLAAEDAIERHEKATKKVEELVFENNELNKKKAA